jgi:hypothetical protein
VLRRADKAGIRMEEHEGDKIATGEVQREEKEDK